MDVEYSADLNCRKDHDVPRRCNANIKPRIIKKLIKPPPLILNKVELSDQKFYVSTSLHISNQDTESDYNFSKDSNQEICRIPIRNDNDKSIQINNVHSLGNDDALIVGQRLSTILFKLKNSRTSTKGISNQQSNTLNQEQINQLNGDSANLPHNPFSSIEYKNNDNLIIQKEQNSQIEKKPTSSTTKQKKLIQYLRKLNLLRSEHQMTQNFSDDSEPKLDPRTLSRAPQPIVKSSKSFSYSDQQTNSYSNGPRCYNCNSNEHKYFSCPQPLTKFCRRCGWENVISTKCPYCVGTLVRPGSTAPVPPGGGRAKKYKSVEINNYKLNKHLK